MIVQFSSLICTAFSPSKFQVFLSYEISSVMALCKSLSETSEDMSENLQVSLPNFVIPIKHYPQMYAILSLSLPLFLSLTCSKFFFCKINF